MGFFYSTRILIIFCFVSGLFLGYGVVELQASPPSIHQPYRTGYHFQPLKNFMNDPNGPFFYRGIYHLFYQYNPIGNGSSNGPRVWGHSTSTDLINWAMQPIAIQAQMPSNKLSSFSGSTTILPGNKPVILFTGVNAQNQQVQDIAVPKNLSDPYLKNWVLIPQNPVIFPTYKNKIEPENFRDPTTAWKLPDGRWRMVIGSARSQRGMAMLFRSKDFIHWIKAKHSLYSEKNSGMWECPDFYPVYVKGVTNVGADTSVIGPNVNHVLKVSLVATQHDVYAIGTYDIKRDAYVPNNGFLNDSSLRYDYGKYYASKSFYDGFKKRRVLFGWVMESIPDANSVKFGWAGIQGIPRNIWLDRSGKQLIQWPIPELKKLREKSVTLPDKVISEGSLVEIPGITANQADVEISFKINNLKNAEKLESSWMKNPDMLCKQKGVAVKGGFGPFGLLILASNGLEEYTAVFFRVFYAHNKHVVLMCSDQTRSSLNPVPEKTVYGTFVDVDPVTEGLFLRVLIDHSVVESFGGKGKKVMTARVYPTLAIDANAHSYVFNNGTNHVSLTRLRAWSMRKARIA